MLTRPPINTDGSCRAGFFMGSRRTILGRWTILGEFVATGCGGGGFLQCGTNGFAGSGEGSAGRGVTISPATADGFPFSNKLDFANSPAAVKPPPKKSMSARKRRRVFRSVLCSDIIVPSSSLEADLTFCRVADPSSGNRPAAPDSDIRRSLVLAVAAGEPRPYLR